MSGTARRPDFLAEASSIDCFYMEATLVAEKGPKEEAADARKNAVYDLLNTIHSPNFYLSLESNGAPASTPTARQFVSALEIELTKLNPDAIRKLIETQGLDSLPSWLFEYDAWRLIIRPVPKDANIRSKPNVRPIAFISDGFQLVNSHARIRSAILDKTSRYGQFDIPFVIAIDVQEVVEEADIMEALFGQERMTVTFGEGQAQQQVTTEMGRDLHGGWTLPHGPRGTRVSGILVAQRLRPWSIWSAAIRLYHNPWSAKPLPSSSALCRVPQSVNRDRTMRPIPGISLGTILGLDTD